MVVHFIVIFVHTLVDTLEAEFLASKNKIRMVIEELCHIMSCERCVPQALHSLPYFVLKRKSTSE
jgi:hypothetical protein